eukprot:jgi/Botrbrau1/10569/Bobra.0343s0017.1
MRREFLPPAPSLVDGLKASDSQAYLDKAACLSTPLMFESESTSFKMLNMQEVQKLALESETVLVLSMKRNPNCSETAPDVWESKAALEVDKLAAAAVDGPALPIAEEERKRISSVYTSHDIEAEPSNMFTLDDVDAQGELLDLHQAPLVCGLVCSNAGCSLVWCAACPYIQQA